MMVSNDSSRGINNSRVGCDIAWNEGTWRWSPWAGV